MHLLRFRLLVYLTLLHSCNSAMQSLIDPVVVIAGGGPAGLLSALTLSRRGLEVTVLEKDAAAEELSPKSYSMGLIERGLVALQKADMLDAVRAKGILRHARVTHESNGTITVQAFPEPRLGILRPSLVSVLEEQVIAGGKVTIRKGVRVARIQRTSDKSLLSLELSDGSHLTATHIVGADGKFSAVRREVAELQRQEGGPELSFTLHNEPSFGLVLGVTDWAPPNWRTDASHLVKPAHHQDCMYAVIAFASPRLLSICFVFNDKVLDTHPWLLPPQDSINGDWSDQPAALTPDQWGERLHTLIATEFPAIARDMAVRVTPEALAKTEIRRRASWVEITTGRFDALDGRVALVGDAAHSMTASIGLGCNCALESAAALNEAISAEIAARRRGGGGGGVPGASCAAASAAPAAQGDRCDGYDAVTPTVEELGAAFVRYGMKRPGEVREAQQQSALGSRK